MTSALINHSGRALAVVASAAALMLSACGGSDDKHVQPPRAECAPPMYEVEGASVYQYVQTRANPQRTLRAMVTVEDTLNQPNESGDLRNVRTERFVFDGTDEVLVRETTDYFAWNPDVTLLRNPTGEIAPVFKAPEHMVPGQVIIQDPNGASYRYGSIEVSGIEGSERPNYWQRDEYQPPVLDLRFIELKPGDHYHQSVQGRSTVEDVDGRHEYGIADSVEVIYNGADEALVPAGRLATCKFTSTAKDGSQTVDWYGRGSGMLVKQEVRYASGETESRELVEYRGYR